MYDSNLMVGKLFASLGFAFLCQNAFPQSGIFPLSEIRAGQQGIGKTVFSGDRVEDFRAEILGVVRDVGPGQSVILARLSGGPLDKTGVMQGMSGSPVYIDGKLVGAVALAFPFSKEPIAGIRPIEEMLTAAPEVKAPGRVAATPSEHAGLINIATPISFHGLSASAIEHFAPELRKLGLQLQQGVSSGGALPATLGDPSRLRPGDMISVQLLSGDMSAGADGTVTAIDGKHVYAFGHQFLASGTTDLPFARAQVIALLPNLNASFKISSPEEWMGSITQDRNTAIFGELGRRALTVPFSIRMLSSRGRDTTYRMQMANDPVLTPLLLQMALFATIEASERAIGPSSYEVRGAATFESGLTPLRFDNSFAGDLATPSLVSSSVASLVAYALSTDLDALHLARINLEIRASEEHRLLNIVQVTASKREVTPGEAVDLFVTLSCPNNADVKKKIAYRVPVGSPVGILQFTVSDASTANLTDYGRLLSTPPRAASQVIAFLNGLRDNRKAYVRVSRSDSSFTVGGEVLPDPPPSLALILARDQPSPNSPLMLGSKIDEIAIDSGGDVVSGSQTVLVQVKQ